MFVSGTGRQLSGLLERARRRKQKKIQNKQTKPFIKGKQQTSKDKGKSEDRKIIFTATFILN